jgi:CO/xanthine dehydrogenase Mo-binding subunit
MSNEPKLLVKGWVPPALDRDFTVVGKRINRRDAIEKVTGKAVYANDISFPDMLYAKILRSPYPHARIKRIDTSKAESLPGVKAVLSKNNTRGWYTYWYKIPQPAFPEVVSFIGQEVAAVAAENIPIALKALSLIEVEYKLLPAVFNAEKALTTGAPIVTYSDGILPNGPFYATDLPPTGNVWGGGPAVLSRGDVEKGFTEADIILERLYTTPFQHHGTLQTRTCVACWDGQKLTIYDSCQGVWQAKEDLALSFKLNPEQVRVIVKYMGGGFGSKSGAQRYAHYAAMLSMVTGRPVKLELTRSEEFSSHPRRPSAIFYLKSGVRKDGKMTAVWGRVFVNIGAGGAYKPFKYDAILHPFYLYNCPNVYLEQWGIITNLQYTGSTRLPLNIIAATCFESHVDELAAAVKIDPANFRLLNYNPYADPVKKTRFSSKNLDKAIKAVCNTIGWENRAAHRTAGRYRRGKGMAVYMFHGVGFPPYEANAELLVKRDGSVVLKMGIVDIGTGSATALSMIAAEELGIDPSQIDIHYGDTEGTLYAPGSHASRVIPEMGPAVLKAAAEAREQLFASLADKLKVNPSNLRSANGYIYSRKNSTPLMSFKEACSLLSHDIVGKGSRIPNPGPYPRGGETAAVNFATFGATAVEVEVDMWTGFVKVIRCATAHEFGKVINPKLVESQHYGGVLFGLGYAMYEEPVLDEKTGFMLNTDLLNYKIPTALEMPEVVCINIESEDPYFAYSAKGGAEGINSAVPAAIRNAIFDAVGVWINDFPITPEKVVKELEKAGVGFAL